MKLLEVLLSNRPFRDEGRVPLLALSNMPATRHRASIELMKGIDKERSSLSFKGHVHLSDLEEWKVATFGKIPRVTKICIQGCLGDSVG